MKTIKHAARSLSVFAATAALLTVTAGAASAAAPAGGCATHGGFSIWAASYGPLTQAVDAAGNDDGWVCVKLLQAPPAGVVIDNTVQ